MASPEARPGGLPAELGHEQLRAALDLSLIPESTAEVVPLDRLTGQDRAQEAIAFGLGIDAEGYNVAISGLPGSGRTTAAQHLVRAAAAVSPKGKDWVYLHNFSDPSHPRAAALPAGLGARLHHDLAGLAEACRNDIPQAFESDSYQERVKAVLEPLNKARENTIEEMQRAASSQGFAVNMTAMGFAMVPLGRDGRPLAPEVLAGLPSDMRDQIEKRSEFVEGLVEQALRDLRKLDASARDAVTRLDQDVAAFVVAHIIEELNERYGPFDLGAHIKSIQDDIMANLAQFKAISQGALSQLPAQLVAQVTAEREALLRRYSANLLVSQADTDKGAPVVEERNPTYHNLLGRIDYEAHFGSFTTDFTHIRPGALHRANGGYLVLQLEDVLFDPRAWLMLKRTLKTRELHVEGVGDLLTPMPAVNLAPEGVPFAGKVVLIGEPLTMALVEMLDPEFGRLFKVRAEFEPDAPVSADTIAAHVRFVRRIADECSMSPFTRDALAELLHFSTRLAGRQDRLSTRFGELSDLCQEAAHLASSNGSATIELSHILKALDGRRGRASMIPDRLREMILEGTRRVETDGLVAGQINGLAVYQVGTHAFGTPMRISCRTGVGRQGVVAIEREVERSGAIHSKGVLVLNGYLTGTFGHEQPLAFTASITFEQSYDEVEGDSASCAELIVILCALAGVPIRQDIAVTGSVDQFGRIQAVGGVTEKVEGFFDVCDARGLTGTQGVIIPAPNIIHLTLRPDVVDAVRQGRFHIWAADRAEEALELVTGVSSGTRDSLGNYPVGTLFERVTTVLEELSAAVGKDKTEA
ncbi:MAG: AAA family ATPase [Dehalococcoidia bacterium]|nr:AAA family ATPase [Dehalococcoidia bacterium]